MNCSVYLFGELSSGYTQYPEDSSSGILKSLHKLCKAPTQVVIHRDGSMIYYNYIRKLHDNKYIGLCIAVNGYYISVIEDLFTLFENTIENMARQGVFVHFAEDGTLTTSLKALKKEENEIFVVIETLRRGFESLGDTSDILPRTDYTLAKDSIKEFSISDDKHSIVRASYSYGFTCIYKKNDFDTVRMNSYRSILKRVNDDNILLKKKNAELQEEKAVLGRKKKQYRYIVLLSLAVTACLSGLFLFYNEITDKSQTIAELGETVLDRDRAISCKDSTIAGLEASVSELRSEMEEMSSFTSTTGATIRNNDSHDNGWIMWLEAKQRVRIESFYVKGSSSGNVKIGLYNANDNLVASAEANVSDSEFRKIQTSDSWTIGRGTYYMRIISGTSLQYHSSSDKEYGQFSNEALSVSGCCSYGDRKENGARTRHGYYQYFYNIRYRHVR